MMQIHPEIARQISKWATKKAQVTRKGGLKEWTPELAEDIQDLYNSPEGIETILHNDYFLNLRLASANRVGDNDIYPVHKEDIIAIYEERKKRPITLVILIEGIGSGKTSLYSMMTYLEWLRLTAKFDPHKYYGLQKDGLIAFIAMNRSESQAKRVTLSKVFPRFKTQFNTEYFPSNKRRGQEIFIERNNTVVFAGTSNAASALGYDVYGGGVDEANFLEVVEGGVRTRGSNEVYDAAEEMHDTINGRIKSRFLNPYTGDIDGMLFMISSSRYPDDFLERKAREHFKLGANSHIFVRRRTLWEAKPKWYFSGIKLPFDLKEKKVLATEEEIRSLREQAKYIKEQQAINIARERMEEAKQQANANIE